MTQALYRKWRPQLWDEVIGQEHVIRTLQNAVRTERVGHAYLFAGPRGTGKTTTARLLAKAINCLDGNLSTRPCDRCEHCQAVNQGRFLDLIEIDAASNTSVEDVRSLRDKINFSPTQGRCKVYIIDEVHMLSTAAFNALLKTLEEPPPHAIFILATTEVHKIPATVLSRCQRHEFRRIPVNEIVSHLTALCKQEKLEIEPDALLLIARQATGSMRDAISLLDQLASTGEKITLHTAQTILGTATSQAVISLVNSILTKQTANGLTCIHQALDSGSDPRQFARQVVEYLRSLLLIQLNHSEQVEATPEVRAQLAQQASQFEPASLLETIRLFNAAAGEIRSTWQPGLPLELAFAQAMIPPRAATDITLQPKPQAPHRAPSPTASPSARSLEEASQKQASSSHKEDSLEKTAPPVQTSDAVEAPPRPKTTADGDLSLAEVRQHWKRIRAGVKQRSMSTEALLNSSRPLGIKNGALILGFATEVLKSKMEIRENLELVCQQIAAATAKEIRLICVVNNKTNFDLDNLEVDSDGMVGTALNLGGQIVQKE
ncbi:MAG: DNA polymerase III subunit gamma/tau [Anaerolineaceae bacterium]|nr:DNA polymerase III subunit gamma/tau [Anaerolineaceae bacterium]